MIINELLEIKYETQKRLDEEAQHSLEKYVENSHVNVQKIATKYKLALKYGKPDDVKSTYSRTPVEDVHIDVNEGQQA